MVKKKYGAKGLKDREEAVELARISRELKRLRKRIAELERRKLELTGG